MGFETYIALAVIFLVVGLAAAYVIRQKKKGRKCIGCPYADQCSGCCEKKTEASQETDEP